MHATTTASPSIRPLVRPEAHRIVLAFETPQFEVRVIAARGDGTIRDPAIREAQRLRRRVFASTYRARFVAADAIDEDRFDAHCDHLVVRERATREVVGTYRILRPEVARRIGYYADGEFDTRALDALKPRMLEFGRSCVAEDHRQGPVVMLLWTALARYMAQGRHAHVIGCASVGLDDGGRRAAALHRAFFTRHASDASLRVVPHDPLPLDVPPFDGDLEPPPLVKGYLRIGAEICGAPAVDRAFNTADFFLLFSLANMAPRYARHFGIERSDERRAA